MAKTSGLTDPATWPPGAAALVFNAGKPGESLIRFSPTAARGRPESFTTTNEIALLAATGWKMLTSWKKIRWQLCALAHGMTGPSIYRREWERQNIEPGKQPISPCARRLTDPNASPHDYTP